MARRDEGPNGLLPRQTVLKDAMLDSAGNVVDPSGAIQSSPNLLLLSQPWPYVSTPVRDLQVVNGAVIQTAPDRMLIHDIMPANESLVDPISGLGNFSLLNISGGALKPIKGASSAPYWAEDAGPKLYVFDGSSGDGVFPATVPGQIEFVSINGEKCIKFTCPAGYGEGVSGQAKRRTQLQSAQFSTRGRVALDLSFYIPADDQAPYDAVSGYNYPVLISQLKTDNSQPFITVVLVTTADPDVYTLRVGWLYSDDSSDASTYNRQLGSNSSGTSNSKSSNTLFTATVRRGQFVDFLMFSYLDERNITTAQRGNGYTLFYLNGQRVQQWRGPTVAYKDIAGALPAAPRWSLGPYLYQAMPDGSSPSDALKEYNLDRATNPAPYNRTIAFRRARLLRLDPPPERDPHHPLQITGNTTLSYIHNGRVLDCTTSLTLTVADTLPRGFSVQVVARSGTTVSVARSGTATLNGASTTLTRAGATNPLFSIQSEYSAPNTSPVNFFVTGS